MYNPIYDLRFYFAGLAGWYNLQFEIWKGIGVFKVYY